MDSSSSTGQREFGGECWPAEGSDRKRGVSPAWWSCAEKATSSGGPPRTCYRREGAGESELRTAGFMKSSFFLFWLFAALGALAHPGGLDANGGHTDRKTGVYHYHRGTNTLTGTNEITTPPGVDDPEVGHPGMETNTVAAPTVDGGGWPASGWAHLPWWVYLVGLGCGYLLWEIASYFWQKRKSAQ
jgi:hypothetical protein